MVKFMRSKRKFIAENTGAAIKFKPSKALRQKLKQVRTGGLLRVA